MLTEGCGVAEEDKSDKGEDPEVKEGCTNDEVVIGDEEEARPASRYENGGDSKVVG
jgi:hypothetical protein